MKTIASYLILVAILLGLLSGCGFKLRGSQLLPESIDTIFINAPLQYSPLSRALQERLPVYQLNGIINTASDSSSVNDQGPIITLQPEQFERRLLSVFSTGQVAEYELVYTIEYTVKFVGADPIENSLSVSREYQDDPDQILAKSRELVLVLDELRSETADRIIRLLSTQYNTSVTTSYQTDVVLPSPLNGRSNATNTAI